MIAHVIKARNQSSLFRVFKKNNDSDFSSIICRRRFFEGLAKLGNIVAKTVPSSCTGSQEPIQKTQQCLTAKQRFAKKVVQWLFPLCTGTPGHNRENIVAEANVS